MAIQKKRPRDLAKESCPSSTLKKRANNRVDDEYTPSPPREEDEYTPSSPFRFEARARAARRVVFEEDEDDDDDEYTPSPVDEVISAEEEDPEEEPEEEEEEDPEEEPMEEEGEGCGNSNPDKGRACSLDDDNVQEKGKRDCGEEELEKGTKPKLLWSEDDVITVLKGIIRFQALEGRHACHNMKMFYEFIRLQLNADVSKSQLAGKIKRLRNKYEVIQDKNFDEAYPYLNESLKLDQFSQLTLPTFGASFLKKKLCSVEKSIAKDFEEKWRKLHIAEIEVQLMRATLIKEQTELILETIK
ncbi:hypothetical protein Tsubulata_033623 [Turnera subulata]|uniref:Glabrous enhancer-binding protein-like DBD domain-containing protein n=1 Tax=Turnera subulata TaxID=218843 RepID=A0A9Q0F336_9ROSI|nr:hypothetical protein Tsubulata_033623 [Turnera subulata]